MKYFVGIDIGGTNVEIGLSDNTGKILGKKSMKTESKKGAEDTFNRIWKKTQELAKDLEIDISEIEAIGMGIPGPVVENSIVKIAANFSWGNDFNAKELMERVSGKLVKVENDVKVISLGEALFGAGRGYKNSITIPIGTGIAAGIIVDGKIVNGAGGIAGEFGHIVIEKDGYNCGCGLKGCLETYCSATGIVREGKRRLSEDKSGRLYECIAGDLEKLEAKQIFDLAKLGDKLCNEIVDFFAEKLAQGIGVLLNLLNPEVIILCGGVAKAGDIIVERVKRFLPKYALGLTLDNLVFSFGELEEEAGIKGAIALVIEK